MVKDKYIYLLEDIRNKKLYINTYIYIYVYIHIYTHIYTCMDLCNVK